MFFEFLRFELRYWFRGYMVYIFLAVMTVLFLGAAGSEFVRVGQAIGSTHRNAPYVIQLYYAVVGILAGLMVTAFVDSAASRDFVSKSSEILFSKPISKASYVFGRFTGASIAALVPSLGVSLGILLAPMFSTIPAERWGPISWQAHLQGILVFAIPNTLIFASFVFALSVWTRSTLYSFIGTLLLIVAYAISGNFLDDMENQTMGALLDPLGVGAYSVITKYWTIDDKNSMSVGLLYGISSFFGGKSDSDAVPYAGLMLLNRVIWLTIVGCVLAIAYKRFSFSEQASRRKTGAAESPLAESHVAPLPATIRPNPGMGWAQFKSLFRNELRGVIRSTVFLVLLATALLNMMPSVWFSATQGYGQSSLPLTYIQIENIRGSLYLFLVAIITFFGGVVIWRDRDARCHEILGALPYPNWALFLSKFLALEAIIAILLLLGIGTGVSAQLASGYSRLQLDVYFQELIVIDLAKMSFLAVLAMVMHTLAPNKYIGYFLFIVFVVANVFVWDYLRIETNLVKFGRLPAYTYSDIFHLAPYVSGLMWFGIYWISVSAVLLWLCVRITHRGVAIPLLTRIRKGLSDGGIASWVLLFTLACCWVGLGTWLTYNTMYLNKLVGGDEAEKISVDYEKTYKSLENFEQPRITKIAYEIEVYPKTRNIVFNGSQEFVNKSAKPIDRLYFNVAQTYETVMEIEGAILEKSDDRLLWREYRLDPALQPNETRSMKYVVKTKTRGIENSVSNLSIVENGTFFNNSIAPSLGYDSGREVNSKLDRARLRLPPNDGFPPLTKGHGPSSMNNYISNESDWVDVETVISTSGDQIAVAPGSLVEEWKKDGRNFFRYRLDHRSLNFYSFISASYAVAREKWNDVDIEVYYHPEHKWNVPRMLQSVRKSLEYCSTNFGPYRHKQARIIEFPRTASFAQAFPGTMPYSESLGFIFDLQDPEDIDMVYYVVAHEMAHQWWAHQVIGAKMQGATLLSETMAQYSALMVMEKEYGREMMQRFLKYEMDSYLRSRGTETRDERPLLTVDPGQGYIHYRKGSVVLYYLKEMIGEEKVNAALRELIDQYAYKDPPYPNAYDLINAFKRSTPNELQYLITDLFEDITSFSNRTTEATYQELDKGRYRVHLKIECSKMKWDGKGKKAFVPLNDWIQIGAFAKPEPGKKYGKLLYREKIHIDQPKLEIDFEVDERPDLSGVDPYYLLIDEILDDNLKKTVAIPVSS